MKEIDVKKYDWFVFDYYTFSGETKMEAELMRRAKILLLFSLVKGEDLGAVVEALKEIQELLAEGHRQWRKVEVKLDEYLSGVGGTMITLHTGRPYLRLRMVQGIWEPMRKD